MRQSARKYERSKKPEDMRIWQIFALSDKIPQCNWNLEICQGNAQITNDQSRQKRNIPPQTIAMRHKTIRQPMKPIRHYFPIHIDEAKNVKPNHRICDLLLYSLL
jgi:hypothetical protein